jgi:hypothetical protein
VEDARGEIQLIVSFVDPDTDKHYLLTQWRQEIQMIFIPQAPQESILMFMEGVSIVQTKLFIPHKVSTRIFHLILRFVRDVMILVSSVLVMILTIVLDVAMVISKSMITTKIYMMMSRMPLVHVEYAVIKMTGGMIQIDQIIASDVIRTVEDAMATMLVIAFTAKHQEKGS